MSKISDLIEALTDEIAVLQHQKQAGEKLLTTLREFFDRFGPLLSDPPTVKAHDKLNRWLRGGCVGPEPRSPHMTAWLRSIRDLIPEPP